MITSTDTLIISIDRYNDYAAITDNITYYDIAMTVTLHLDPPGDVHEPARYRHIWAGHQPLRACRARGNLTL